MSPWHEFLGMRKSLMDTLESPQGLDHLEANRCVEGFLPALTRIKEHWLRRGGRRGVWEMQLALGCARDILCIRFGHVALSHTDMQLRHNALLLTLKSSLLDLLLLQGPPGEPENPNSYDLEEFRERLRCIQERIERIPQEATWSWAVSEPRHRLAWHLQHKEILDIAMDEERHDDIRLALSDLRTNVGWPRTPLQTVQWDLDRLLGLLA